jgi:hypothetical protein
VITNSAGKVLRRTGAHARLRAFSSALIVLETRSGITGGISTAPPDKPLIAWMRFSSFWRHAN